MRILVAIGAALLLFFSVTVGAAPVVQVRTEYGTGSAFFLSETLALTAAHVVDDYKVGDPVVLVDTQGDLAIGIIHAFSKDHDAALLYVPFHGSAFDLEVLHIRDTALVKGESLIAHGFSGLHGMYMKSTHSYGGTESEGSRFAGDVVLDGSTHPGMSGGAVLDSKGRVVGILVAGVVRKDGLSQSLAEPVQRAVISIRNSLED